MNSIDSLSINSDPEKNEFVGPLPPTGFSHDYDLEHDPFALEPPSGKIDSDILCSNILANHYSDVRNEFSAFSREIGQRYSYVDTSFDDLAMAIEANSPDFMDGKPFNFEVPTHSSSNGKVRLRWTEEMVKCFLYPVSLP